MGEIIKLSPNDIIVAEGEHLEVTCLVRGRDFNFVSSWNVSLSSSQQYQDININDNSIDPYRFAISSTDPIDLYIFFPVDNTKCFIRVK